MSHYSFADRHNGPNEAEIKAILQTVGAKSLDELIEKIIPSSIRLTEDLNIPEAMSEFEFIKELRETANKNQLFKNYIGLGYYNTITPGVILRNVFENPGWYTAYTPYQAEIAQGRMEALLNFQTMIIDLTGMEIANASLLDEATAAAEAMTMFFHTRTKEQEKNNVCKFFVADDCFPQTIDVIRTRAKPLGIELEIGNATSFNADSTYFGALLQYPCGDGEIRNYSAFVKKAHDKAIKIVVAADIMSLVLLTPPGEWGADAVVGCTQRFGVPMGYGGPHAGYFATKEIYKRDIPGRIIGVSVDVSGNRALRMALQTREQHIKRDKATSNICTAQVLLAVMASMYAVYHGHEGLKAIATTIHKKTLSLAEGLKKLGYKIIYEKFFDTIKINTSGKTDEIRKIALEAKINFRYESENILISIDETILDSDVNDILEIFAKALNQSFKKNGVHFSTGSIQESLSGFERKTSFMTHPVFNTYHSETNMLRYITKLENKDLSLNHSMIALGSCTMKLNATSEMIPLSWNHFSRMHPFQPVDQVQGYGKIIKELEEYLCTITGFSAVSLQPNSGAQGEYAGLMVIHEYLRSTGQNHRDIVLIPQSAHGTNPASAVLAGLKIVVVKCDIGGNIDFDDLKSKAVQYKDSLAALMVTYPSTHGVYEEGIKKITDTIHENGGQVYMDGANMNAQVGLTNPAMIGADVCHLNLHKTFAIPHGGGGPGMGPIGVAAHLAPYLPSHPIIKTGGEKGVHAVSAAPWGSASILLISYAYIKMLGRTGLKLATQIAILNANYICKKLEKHYPILYKGANGFVAHEMILDCRSFKTSAQIEVTDIAKRLMDYGFHAPTVAFPVAGTLMVEPTESESKEELDRFCEAMISIRKEIEEIEKGKSEKGNNALTNAPHTALEVISDNWNYPYSRQQAAFPIGYVKENKFWPGVKRVDNAYGDRNLICSCPSVESYDTSTVNV
ncbi:MAG: aminomethyl-transferring glycine dehydrogenase [Bacteroidota bacterium]